MDRQSNGVLPAMGDCIQPTDITGLRDLTQRKRFNILWDKTRIVNTTTGVNSGVFQHYKLYMKFRRPLVVEYNAGVAGSIADIVSNALILVAFGSEPAGPSAGFVVGTARIRYTDM